MMTKRWMTMLLVAILLLAPGPAALAQTYPLMATSLLHAEAVELRASTPKEHTELGVSVALSGDVLVAGAPREDVGTTYNIGAAYVFHRDQSAPGAWGEVQILRADNGEAGDQFGISVAASGDVIVVGAPFEDGVGGASGDDRGAVYVFQRVLPGTDHWEQKAILRASDAAIYDNFGYSVAVSGDVIVVGAWAKNSADGAAYVFQRDQGSGGAWGQTTILQVTGEPAAGQFGISVAVDRDVIVVGANYGDSATTANTGAAYVFQRNQGGANAWGRAAALYASDAQANDYFGLAVGVSGDVIVVSAPGEDGGSGSPLANAGAAYVFQRQQGGANHWGQVRKLMASDAQADDGFGGSVAASGDGIVVGSSLEKGGVGDPRIYAGAAYVFQRNGGGKNRWGQAQILRASDTEAGDFFGTSVAISGDGIVAGAPNGDDASGTLASCGAAYVFLRTENDPWRQTAIEHASDATEFYSFGESAAISGDVLVVGAAGTDTRGTNAGAAYVFQRDQGGAGAWGELPAILYDSDANEEDYFGFDVAVSGDVIVVGEPYKDVAAQNDGAAYIFERDQGGANQWYEVKLLQIPGGAADDRFGTSVAVSGDVAVVGALYKDTAGSQAGAAYVYQRNQGGPDGWGLVQTLQASDLEAGDNFGMSVSVSGDVIVVGAWQEDGGGSNAGAAYVFHRNQGGTNAWGQVKKLVAPDSQAGDHFGVAVAAAGEVIVVGANARNGYTGAAYVFQRDEGGPGAWGWMKTLDLPDEVRAGSSFGGSVAVSRDVIVVGASQHDGPEESPIESAGAAFVYRRNEGGINLWDIMTPLRASDAQADDYFGAVVGASGDVIVVGAFGEDGGVGDPKVAAGAAYIFQSAPLVHLYLPLVVKE